MTEAREQSWSDRVNAALERVAWKVLERAEQTGTPIIEWEDGRVVEVPPRVVRERLENRKAAAERERSRGTDDRES